MQKWYEEGYFAIDLLMRRAHLDEDWTPVGELAQRAGSERIFFFNFDAPAAPPGLPRRRDPSRDHFQQQREPNGYNAPYQPVPTRTVHPNLDSYFASSSPASNSPSSSFGVGRFGNNSPDPATFGGLVGAPMSSNGSPLNLRPGTFTDPAFIGTRRTGYADPPFEQGFSTRAGIGNAGPTGTSSVDSYGLNSSIPSQPPWSSSTSAPSASLNIRTSSYDHMGPGPFASHLASGSDPAYSGESSLTRGLTAQQDVLGQNFGNVNQRDLSRLGPRDLYQLEHHAGLGLGGFDGPSGSPFESPVQQQPFNQSPSTNFASPAPQQTSSPSAITPPAVIPASNPSTMPLSQSTWPEAAESAPKRSGLTPFDNTAFPTSRNTTATRTAPPPPAHSWTAIQQSTSGDSSQSPWSSASQGIVDHGWGHVPGPHSLTVSNLTQHTQQQESGEDFSCDDAVTVDSPVEPTTLPEHVRPPIQSSSIPGPAEPPQQPHRPSRKFSVQTNLPQPTTPTTPTSAITQPTKEPTPSTSTVSAPTKPVWSTEDDKNKSTGGPTSLREIQEMEAKKQEARKTAERERARATAAAAAANSEDSQPFTASWGLPTSQVGAKTPSKEAVGIIVPSTSSSMSATVLSAMPAQSTPVAVWTNAQKPAAKKSMRDILEEEERRKKVASKESVASAAARRAYAETTNKVCAIPVRCITDSNRMSCA
jgi:PERQ amino acid-rich with GYF domain-containing protein